MNALVEPEADLSALGRWLFLSSELLTACWPQRRKEHPKLLLSLTERWPCCSICLLLLRDITRLQVVSHHSGPAGSCDQAPLPSCTEANQLAPSGVPAELSGCYGQQIINRQKLGTKHIAASHLCSKFCAWVQSLGGDGVILLQGKMLPKKNHRHSCHRFSPKNKTDAQVSVTQHLCPGLEKHSEGSHWLGPHPLSGWFWWLQGSSLLLEVSQDIYFHWGCQAFRVSSMPLNDWRCAYLPSRKGCRWLQEQWKSIKELFKPAGTIILILLRF